MRDRLDELLDGALAGYVEEPRAGLERRVLHRVRSERKRSWLLIPVFAVPVLAGLMLVFVVTRPVSKPMTAVAVVVPPVPEVKRSEVVVTPRIVRPKAVLPRKDVFPSPLALTDGERALLALSHQHPETASRISKTGSESIEIQLLEIRPLQAEIVQ